MGKRTKTGQAKHDNGVLKSIKYYESQSYKVKADLPNYEKPKSINGCIPDAIIKKGKKEIILEVETKKTLNSDEKQRNKFQNYASRSKNRKFRTKVV